MKRILLLPLIIGLSILASCQKQQTDAERQAAIDNEVQRRLDAEHQSQQKDQLDQRASDVDAREKELKDKESAAESAPVDRDEEETPDRQYDDAEPNERGVATASYDTFYTKLDPYGD